MLGKNLGKLDLLPPITFDNSVPDDCSEKDTEGTVHGTGASFLAR